MSSAVRGGPEIAPGKHPTSIRLWREKGEIGQVCGPCLAAMPDVPLGIFGTATDKDGNETDVQIGGDI